MYYGDCDQLLTEDELFEPFYNAVRTGVCDNCFETYSYHKSGFDFRALEDVIGAYLLSVEKARSIICKIREVVSE